MGMSFLLKSAEFGGESGAGQRHALPARRSNGCRAGQAKGPGMEAVRATPVRMGRHRGGYCRRAPTQTQFLSMPKGTMPHVTRQELFNFFECGIREKLAAQPIVAPAIPDTICGQWAPS
jgi:hypothetical protein